jgi:hypothetical protein
MYRKVCEVCESESEMVLFYLPYTTDLSYHNCRQFGRGTYTQTDTQSTRTVDWGKSTESVALTTSNVILSVFIHIILGHPWSILSLRKWIPNTTEQTYNLIPSEISRYFRRSFQTMEDLHISVGVMKD